MGKGQKLSMKLKPSSSTKHEEEKTEKPPGTVEPWMEKYRVDYDDLRANLMKHVTVPWSNEVEVECDLKNMFAAHLFFTLDQDKVAALNTMQEAKIQAAAKGDVEVIMKASVSIMYHKANLIKSTGPVVPTPKQT